MQPGRAQNFFSLVSSDSKAIDFALSKGILRSTASCPNCHRNMQISDHTGSIDGKCLRCHHCHTRTSIRHNTILESSKLSVREMLIFLYMWSQEHLISEISEELGLSDVTMSRLTSKMRAAVDYDAKNVTHMIGGWAHVVEVDETQLSRKKHDMGRAIPCSDVWVVGGIDRHTGEIFLEKVPSRSGEVLMDVIKRHVIPWTEIHTDSWLGYNVLDKMGSQYVHLTVNHNKGYVDYETGAHTQNIERLWRDFKQKKKMQYGIFRRYVDSYCNEFVWRRNTLQRGKDIFEATLELVARCAWDEVSYFP